MKRLAATLAALTLFSTAPALALDADLSFTLADKYYARWFHDDSAARFQYDLTLSQDFLENWNFTGILWASQRLSFMNGGITTPEELDYQGFLTFTIGDFSVCANGSAFTVPGPVSGEFGMILNYELTPLELLAIKLEAAAYYDLTGFYEELKAEPALSLPVGAGIKLALPVTLSAIQAGFGQVQTDGLAGISAGPRLTVIFNDTCRAGVSVSYFQPLNSVLTPYLGGGIFTMLSFSTPAAETAPGQDHEAN